MATIPYTEKATPSSRLVISKTLSKVGRNILASTNFKNVEKAVFQILNGRKPEGKIPEFWDGKTAERIVRILVNKLNQ